MSKVELQAELRKMQRKVGGNKEDLCRRLEEVFETNDRGWAIKCTPTFSGGRYLASGSFRDVYLMEYTKGPRKGQRGVYKLFRAEGKMFDWAEIDAENRTVEEAGRIIQAFNAHNDAAGPLGRSARRRVYLNKPEIWNMGQKRVFVEPLIEGHYSKFNSNSGWVNDGYQMMQALSHFSYHFSRGQYLLCDLQGGGFDTHYILTDPAILSVGREFGPTDGGRSFMETFFAHHKCNDYCDRSWLRMAGAQPRVPVRRGTSFVPQMACRSTAIDAICNKNFRR